MSLSITYSDDAWDLMYQTLRQYVGYNYSVTLNRSRSVVQLCRIDGWTAMNNDAQLIVVPWSEERQDWGEELAIPLFKEDGSCNITKMKVL